MSRDHRRLRVYRDADALVLCIYRASQDFPREERFGCASQLRRAALSIVCNIVEGSARRSSREYRHFLNVAAGSLAETRYLVDLSGRLGFLPPPVACDLETNCRALAAALEALQRSLRAADDARNLP